MERNPKIHGSYIREAWQNGVAMQDSRGYNPYKMGVVGASDSHNTASGYSQSDYFGGHGLLDATPKERLSGKKEQGLNTGSPQHRRSGWRVGRREHARVDLRSHAAQRNLRHKRRPHPRRILRRLELQPDVLNQKDWVKAGYANGVPMGSDLPEKAGQAPTFIVWASKTR